jgi:methyltransferase
MTAAGLVLMLVTLQRLAELLIARRNTARLLSRGGIEVAPRHYPLLVGLHAVWLAGLWYFVVSRPLVSVDVFPIALFISLQGLRVWVLVTLGQRWTTRIIVMPGEQLVARGPYRYLSHPNYCIVVGEILVLPLAFGLVWYGLAFSLLNFILLWVRIGAENKALSR